MEKISHNKNALKRFHAHENCQV